VKSASAKDTSVSNKKYVARRSIISHSVSVSYGSAPHSN
jgi:hypothetical protein